jgi:hypothetical protein
MGATHEVVTAPLASVAQHQHVSPTAARVFVLVYLEQWYCAWQSDKVMAEAETTATHTAITSAHRHISENDEAQRMDAFVFSRPSGVLVCVKSRDEKSC